MLREMTNRFNSFDMAWKPDSLEILPGSSIASDLGTEFVVEVDDGAALRYTIVEELLLLGELLNGQGETTVSMAYRQNLAMNAYYKHRASLQSSSGLALRLHAWMSTPGSVALHGSESWHITATNMQNFQTWEYQQLRRMFKFRRKPEEEIESFNKRTAARLRHWFSLTGTLFSTHRILKKLYKDAWLEKVAVLPSGENPLQTCRGFRTEQWWQTVCMVSSQYKRHKTGLQHRRQGHRPAWEDIFCKVFDMDWRTRRDSHPNLGAWMSGLEDFLQDACAILGIAPPVKRSLPAALDAPYTHKDKCGFADIPDLPPHPDDQAWDSGSRRLWIVVDCKGVADVSTGNAVLQAPHLEPIFQRTSNMLLRICENGWRPKRDTDDMITWAPRKYNVVADHLANAAMDCKRDWHWEDVQHLVDANSHGHGIRLKVCVDGGLRRSSNDASMAVAIFLARDGGTFTPILYAANMLQGVCSAFQTEVHSLESAMTHLIRVFGKA
jgi:hypothetical protein